jgi:hypothetical protein
VPAGNWACPCCPQLPRRFELAPQPVRHPLDTEICKRLAAASANFGRLSDVWDSGLQLYCKIQFYNAIVMSTLLYCAETWAPLDPHVEELEVFHRRCLRKIKGLDSDAQGHLSSTAQLHSSGIRTYPISEFILQHRLRFLGHLARREESFLPKHMLFAHWLIESDFSRARGRPLKSYCQVAIASLSEISKRLDVHGIDLGADVALWLILAGFRVWWRKDIVDRARGAVA